MSVVGLDHAFITIPSGAEDESRRFYGELLGLKEIPSLPAWAPPVWFQAGNQELHLGAYEDHAAPKRPHPGSRVESATALEELAHRLDEAGVEPKWGDRIEGRKRFYVRDPFGSRVELLTDL
jgi:catechol 2,3-dioxygenase-like lactoylglutathione lyase family enzyme